MARESSIILVGTGTSAGIPVIGCLTDPDKKCAVCLNAVKKDSKNYRRNTGAIIEIETEDGSKTLVIDAGKTFYHGALELFPKHGLRRIDALLITHPHADAYFGMDDLRGWTLANSVQNHIDIYCDQETMDSIAYTFPYMVDGPQSGGGDIPQFKYHIIDRVSPFTIPECGNIQVQPLLVEHGIYFSTKEPFMTLGFRIGDLSYISDISSCPDATKLLIDGSKTIILDALREGTHHLSHYSVEEAVAFIDGLKTTPKQTFLVGMSHKVDHDTVNSHLLKLDNYIRLGYDGLQIAL